MSLAGFTSSGLAVGTGPSTSTLSSAMEVLRLPGQNRRMVVQSEGEKYYKNFISLAFSEEQPMSLRWKALMAAAESQGVKSTEDLIRASAHKQWYMRNAALIALREVNPEKGEQVAKKLLKDKALVVRSAAVEVLNKSLSPAVRDLLWAELYESYNFKNTQSLWIRHQIVDVLAKQPLDREIKGFAELLSDKDLRVQGPAVRGLEKLTGMKLGRDSESPEKLVTLWKDYFRKESLN